MTEQELLRTALILPPRARAVLCVWAAVPGLLCAPFVFWQSLFAGLCFCAVWGLLVLALRLRACSFVAALSPRSLTVQAGIGVGNDESHGLFLPGGVQGQLAGPGQPVHHRPVDGQGSQHVRPQGAVQPDAQSPAHQ